MKALIFNGSGILLDSELAGIREFLIYLGKEKEMLKQKEEYDRRKNKGAYGLEILASLYKGISEKEILEISQKLVKEKLRKGAKEIIAELRKRGYKIANYISDLINVGEALKRELGLDDVCGNVLEFENGVATGKLKEKVDRYDRAKRIKKLMQEYNLTEKEVYIVGDSITAVPSAEFGIIIALNSKSRELNDIARYRISRLDGLLGILN